MTNTLTFSMIKPDAIRNNYSGSIITMIENAGFNIKLISKTRLTQRMAECFYEVHAQKPFYKILCENISSGPVIAMVLEKDNAIQAFRTLIGATNPLEAANGTIRKAFGVSVDENAIHGSDSKETAAIEIAFFFAKKDLI